MFSTPDPYKYVNPTNNKNVLQNCCCAVFYYYNPACFDKLCIYSTGYK